MVRRYRRGWRHWEAPEADGIEDMGRVMRCFGMGRRPILF